MTHRIPLLNRMTRLKRAFVVLATLPFILLAAPLAVQVLPGAGSLPLVGALGVSNALADSYYQVNACYGTTLTWQDSGTGVLSDQCNIAEGEDSLTGGAGTYSVWNADAPNYPGANYVHAISGSGYTLSATANEGSAGWVAADPAWAAGQGTGGNGRPNSPTASDPYNTYFGAAQALGLNQNDCVAVTFTCGSTQTAFAYPIPDQSATAVGFADMSAAGFTLDSPVVTVDDPDTTPTVTGDSSSLNSASQWYSYDADNSVTGSVTVADNSGVCDLQLALEDGSGNVVSGSTQGGLNNAGGDWDPGSATFNISLVGTATIAAPCAGSPSASVTSSVSLANIATPGTYQWVADSQNPSNVESVFNPAATGYSPTEGTADFGTINVDNTVPTLSITDNNAGGGSWVATGGQSYTVAVAGGPSGIASVTCSGNGLGTPDGNGNATNGSDTYTAGDLNSEGGNTYAVTVPVSGNGIDSISCSATSGAAVPSSGVTTPAGGQVIQIDTVPPTVVVAPDNTGILNSWTNQSQDVTIAASSGISGIVGPDGSGGNNAVCTISRDGTGAQSVQDGGSGTGWTSSSTASSDAGEWDLNFTETGRYAISCETTNGAGVHSSTLTTTVEVDKTDPSDLAAANGVIATGLNNVDGDGNPTPSTNTPGFVETDATVTDSDNNPVTITDGSVVNNADAQWTGDAAQVVLDPGDASANQTSDPRSPIVSSSCQQIAVSGVSGVGNGGTIPSTTQSASGSGPLTNTLNANGEIDLDCSVTNAAGTTSDTFDYYLNLDQIEPDVSFDNDPTGESSQGVSAPLDANAENAMVEGTSNPSVAAAYTAKVLAGQQAAIQAGVPARAFARPTLEGGNGLIAMDGAQAAQGLPNGVNNSNATLAFYDAATSTDATPAESQNLSGISGGKCEDYNATTGGSPATYLDPADAGNPDGGESNVMPGGASATLAVPTASVQAAGIQEVDCQAATNGSLPSPGSLGWNDNAQTTPSTDELDIDNAVPATVSFAGDTSSDPSTWYSNEATINVTADPVNNEPYNDLSNIAAVTCAVDDPTFGQAGDPNATIPGEYQSFPVSSSSTDPYTAAVEVDENDTGTLQGAHIVSCFATNGAGLNGTVNSVQTYVQNGVASQPIPNPGPSGPPSSDPNCVTFCSAPTGPFSGTTTYGATPNPNVWLNAPYTTTVTATQPADEPPITDIVCDSPPVTAAGGEANTPESGLVDYPNPNPGQTETVSITVGSPGGWVMCYAAYDDPTTGSEVPLGGLGAFQALIDTDNPTGYFEKRDSDTPSVLKLYATDATSGVGKVVIELVPQGGGATITLPITSTTVGNGLYSASIPSTTPTGTWTAKALVTDLAGNESTITAVGSDSGAALSPITTPVGVATSISYAAVPGTKIPPLPGSTSCTTTTQTVTKKVKGKKVTVYVTKKVKGKKVKVAKTKKVKVCAKAASAAKTLVLKYGEKLALHGQVTSHQSGQTQAAPSQTVTIVQTVAGVNKTLKTLTTNSNGEFQYVVAAGPSRTIAISYSGSEDLAATASSPLATKVAGNVTLRASAKTLVQGHTLVLSGQITGGYLPSAGPLVKLQYLIVGPGDKWGAVDTYRANGKTGKFSIKLPIKAGSGGHVYEFRVNVPNQTGWAWTTVTSKIAKVKFTR